MKKLSIVISLLIILFFTAKLYAIENNDVYCFPVGWWAPHGDPLCAYACTDGSFYPMPCDSDIFQQ